MVNREQLQHEYYNKKYAYDFFNFQIAVNIKVYIGKVLDVKMINIF